MSKWNEHIKPELGGCGTNVYIGYNCIFTNPEKIFLGDNVRIDPFTLITTELRTGNYVHLCAGSVLSGGSRHIVTLGNWCWVGYHSCLFCASEDYSGDYGPVMEFWNRHNRVDHDNITFKDYSGVASHVTVMPGTVLPDGCAIGAQSLVNRTAQKKLEQWGVFFGHPLIKKKARNESRILEVANNVERGKKMSDQEIRDIIGGDE